jgi:hypothetical protein
MKKVLVITWLIILLFAVVTIFWYNDFVYHLPTPIPSNYKPAGRGQIIKLTGALQTVNSKPLFLHFFNPACPCSRFNLATFKSLVNEYRQQVDFAVIVMSSKRYTAKEIQDKFDISAPIFFDVSIADSCGVYSTPQVVLLDQQHKLYYRGNYNTSRYCLDERSNYAKMAINGLLKRANISFSKLALTPYGCQLPNCTK